MVNLQIFIWNFGPGVVGVAVCIIASLYKSALDAKDKLSGTRQPWER